MRTRRTITACLLGLLLAAWVTAVNAAEGPNGVVKQTDVMVPMRDGKRMAADVYRPKDASKKYPAIFVRTPYNFNYWDVRLGAPRDLRNEIEAVKRGYAFVEMNERGHFFSEGNYDILGAPLTDAQIQGYLTSTDHPQQTQHALSQIADRIIRGDKSVARWYPDVVRQATSLTPQVRETAAWVMGQDNTSPQFHETLLGMLDDSEPLVRMNAALALVCGEEEKARGEVGIKDLATRERTRGTRSTRTRPPSIDTWPP